MAHNPSAQSDEANAGNTSRTKGRQLCLVIVAFLVFLLVVVLLLPTLINTTTGTRMALDVLNKRIAGQVDVEKMKVSWFGPQRIDGLYLRDPNAVDILSAQEVTASDISLFSAALGTGLNGHVKLTKFVAQLERFEDGSTNVQRAIAGAADVPLQQVKQPSGDSPRCVKPPRKAPRNFSLSIEVVDAEVTYKRPDGAPIVTNIPTAVFDLSDMRKIMVKVQGTVTQEGQTGQMQVNAMIEDLFDAEGVQTVDKAEFNAQAKLHAVPVAGLDAMANQDGLLVALLGPRADGDIELKGSLSNLAVKMDAKTKNLTARAHATGHADRLEMHGDAIELTVTPEAWLHLAKRYPALAETKLLAPVAIAATINRLDVPLDQQGKPVLQRASINGDVQVGNLTLDAGPPFGRLGLQDTQLSLTSDAMGTAVSLAGSSVAVQESHRGQVGLQISVSDLLDNVGRVNLSGLSTIAAVELVDLPVAFLDQFAPPSIQGITQIVGPVLSAKLDARLKPIPDVEAITGPVTLTATSEHFRADLNLFVQEDLTIAQKTGQTSSIELMMTPQGLNQMLRQVGWDDPKQIELVQPSRLHLAVQDAQIALLPAAERLEPGGLPFDLNHCKLIATLTADTKAMRFPTATSTLSGEIEVNRVREVRINLNAPDPRRQVDVDVEASIDASGANAGSDLTPTFVSKSRINGLVDASGAMNLQSATIHTNAHASDVPVSLLDAALQGEGQLLALLGQTATFTLGADRTADIPGKLNLSLESENARALVQGTIEPVADTVEPEWRLALSQDIKASLTVTPELGKRYLAALNPLLADVHSAEKPVELTIRKEGFEAPLNKLDLDGLKMQGQMELGTLTMSQGSIGRALVLGLRAAGSPIADRHRFDAKFTTLHFAINDGVIESDDLWMDTGDLLLGTQARVYRGKRSGLLKAKMLMGIPGETVRLIPKVGDRIQPEALFTLPVSGRLTDLEPNFIPLLMRIATEAALGDVGGGVGQLLVGIGAAVIDKSSNSEADGTWRNATWANRPAFDRYTKSTDNATEADAGGEPRSSDVTGNEKSTTTEADKKTKKKKKKKKKRQ